MNDLVVKHFEKHDVRFQLDEAGQPWFVAQDICDALSIKYSNSALKKLDSDQRGTVKCSSGGQIREFSAVNKSGTYTLIMRSDKPAAKKFTRWITDEVLPSIEKTGSYTLPTVPVKPRLKPIEDGDDPLDVVEIYFKEMREYRRRVSAIAEEIREVAIVARQDDDTLTADQITEIDKLIYARAKKYTGSDTNDDYWKFVTFMRSSIKKKFYEPGMGSSRTYKELPRRDFDAAKSFIISHQISFRLNSKQRQLNLDS
jgi:hypothetical protein